MSFRQPLTKVISKCFIILAFAIASLVVATPPAGTTGGSIQAQSSGDGLEFFEKKIRPVLVESCYSCHKVETGKPAGGLALDSIEAMIKGGESGQPAVVPGEPGKSLLMTAIRQTDSKLQMPPGGWLNPEQIRDFEVWIRMGAPAPKSEAKASSWQPYDLEKAKLFWSFQPVRDVIVPRVSDESWVRTPIDRFILAKLEEKGLKPLSDADKRTLLRRATFDLTGLPPAPDEVDAFLRDDSQNAFEKVIDRLLASKAYGEKWGRHWLDLVRYADTAGDNSDYPVPAAFRYRNYVIDSFNNDKPYDRFIREQIAGDLMPHTGDESRREGIIATGYIAMSRRFGSRNESMNLTIDDTIDNLGKTYLGLSVSCARCHDHKFDPIPNRDYYSLYGIFNSIRYAFPGAEIYKHPAEMVALENGKRAEAFYKHQQELNELDDLHEKLTAEKGTAARNKKMKEQPVKDPVKETPAPVAEKTEKEAVKAVTITGAALKPADYNRDAENWRQGGLSKRMPEDVEAEMMRVKARIAELHNRNMKFEKAYAVVEGLPHNARIHRKGDPKKLGDEAPRGFLTILGGQQVPTNHGGSGRDLLAEWIADPCNPLTARVMVNRLWHYHFGKGLVQTPNDFGTRGKAPTHPELLDYLAARFVEGGWSIKSMHKQVMLSHAYRLSSKATALEQAKYAANEKIDIGNDMLWRFNRRRLEAEEIRDAIMAVSGTLDRSMGAEHPFPEERDWRYTQHVQFFDVYESNRRSVYVMQQRLKKHPFFEVFDGADQNATTDVRGQSITPVQALFLMNSRFMHDQADQFAVRAGLAYDTMPARINYAYRQALGRSASLAEVRDVQQYLQRMRQELREAGTPDDRLTRGSLASFLRVLLSGNEFLYLD